MQFERLTLVHLRCKSFKPDTAKSLHLFSCLSCGYRECTGAAICCGYRGKIPTPGCDFGAGPGYGCKHTVMFSSRAHAKMSVVQKLSRFQVRFLQHARRRRHLDSLVCVRVPVPSSYSGALSTQAAASGVKTWNESRWVCQSCSPQ